MHLPPGADLLLVGLAAFLVCLGVLSATTRRGAGPSYDELERVGTVNGIRLRRTAARPNRARLR